MLRLFSQAKEIFASLALPRTKNALQNAKQIMGWVKVVMNVFEPTVVSNHLSEKWYIFLSLFTNKTLFTNYMFWEFQVCHFPIGKIATRESYFVALILTR